MKLLIVFVIIASMSASCSSKKEREIKVLSTGKSDLDTTETRALFERGITYKELTLATKTIPMLRVGPGYLLYWLKDGSLTIPITDDRSKQVGEWELQPYQTKKAEQLMDVNRP